MSAGPYSFSYLRLGSAHLARGVVVVIDVCRAFTTAAYAFAAGAQQVLLAGTLEEAVGLRERHPGALLMGEVGGLPIPGFDLWNSPTQLSTLDLSGRTLIQRTSAGTQGVVRASGAERLLAASFVVAGATARAIAQGGQAQVSFVITGLRDDEPGAGQEDVACADYLTALLNRSEAGALPALPPDPAGYMTWLKRGEVHLEGASPQQVSQFEEDMQLCALVDSFDFAMEVRYSGDERILEKRNVPAT